MKGVLDESETKLCDALKCERDKLLVRLKNENKRIVSLQRASYQDNSDTESSLPVDLTLADDIIAVCDDNEEDIPATIL
ncbi:uncharacterized protein LOC119692077 [Plutella xylostella]|uniref:uncharacterized protein LOC119692077 n=1 Tax=Plutella xylostella TaxID=51655 RepID=UPI002032EFCD|nr:uncharacterized protein LOC119692077 [Plutella xylostella]